IQSPGAVGVRLHLSNVILAKSDRLFIYQPGSGIRREVYGAANVPLSHEIYSTTAFGDTVTLELQDSSASDKDSVARFEIVSVSHLYRLTAEHTAIGDAGACNLDLSCYPDWLDSGNSAALINYEIGTTIYFCSGALINN